MALIDPDEPCPCGSGKTFAECHGPRVRSPVTPEITQTLQLKVIPEPAPNTRAIFIYDGEGTVIMSGVETGLSMNCGNCNAPLIRGLRRDQVSGLVLRCKGCGSFNDTNS